MKTNDLILKLLEDELARNAGVVHELELKLQDARNVEALTKTAICETEKRIKRAAMVGLAKLETIQ
ncbi:hypothetical protein [Vibrio campbellii]|uniref:hypothetical protein n=1 Tax=Vibrio campbellii TaxID=680 RepID=UPI003F846F02